MKMDLITSVCILARIPVMSDIPRITVTMVVFLVFRVVTVPRTLRADVVFVPMEERSGIDFVPGVRTSVLPIAPGVRSVRTLVLKANVSVTLVRMAERTVIQRKDTLLAVMRI
jgi:hypothetical protein